MNNAAVDITVDHPSLEERAKPGAAIADPKNLVAGLFSDHVDGLAKVEARMKATFRSDSRDISDISGYLLSLGGKRIRPLLALVSAKLFGLENPSSQLIDAAAGIELIHMATLLHDDIIDRSPTRRHKPSAYVAYGLDKSLVTGDFLLARAFGLCAHLDMFVVEATERACVELTEGEILEGRIENGFIPSIADYLNVVRKKTASLFGLAGAVGAHLAGASDNHTEMMTEFGYTAGVAFQMVDDILDITANEDLLGKPCGTDLRQKTPSLVNILWIERERESALAFFNRAEITEELAKQTTEYLRASSVIKEARDFATRYVSEARRTLASIPAASDQPGLASQLDSLLEYTLQRAN